MTHPLPDGRRAASRLRGFPGRVGLPFRRGATAGAAAYLLGVFCIRFLVDWERTRAGLLFPFDFHRVYLPATESAGVVFYHGQFVAAGKSRLVLRNVGPEFLGVAAVAVPVVLLAAAGYVAGSHPPTDTPSGTALAGATVALGYLPLAVAGAVLLGGTAVRPDPGAPPVGIDPWLAAAIVGVTYPVVFGAAGGALVPIGGGVRNRLRELAGNVGVPLRRGAAFGGAAYLLGYLLFRLLRAWDDPGGSQFPSWTLNVEDADVAGWLLYNAHFVDVVFEVGDDGRGSAILPDGWGSRNLLVELSWGVPEPALFAVPPALLVAGGYATARGTAGTLPRSGLAGAAVTLGYLPLVAAGAVLFAGVAGAFETFLEREGLLVERVVRELTAGIDPVVAVALAGIAYPVTFGGLGGVLAGLRPARGAAWWNGRGAVRGVAFGAGAHATGYLAVGALWLWERVGGHPLAGTDVATTDLVGWLFYNAHFVDVVVGTVPSRSLNLVATASWERPELVYFLVPVATLTAAGYLAAGRSLAAGADRRGRPGPRRAADPKRAAAVGATVALGYLPLAVAGAVLLGGTASGAALPGPPPTPATGPVPVAVDAAAATVRAGVVYPALFGGLGGVLAARGTGGH